MNFNRLLIQNTTVIFFLISLITLVVIVVLYSLNLTLFRQSIRQFEKVNKLMGRINKDMKLVRHQIEILSGNLIKFTQEDAEKHIFDSEQLIAEPKKNRILIPKFHRNEKGSKKQKSKRQLDEIINTHVDLIDQALEEAKRNNHKIEVTRNPQPSIQDEILELLKSTGKPTHYQNIIDHLLNVFPDSEVNAFMIELEGLERMRKIEADVVGGDVHYNLSSRITG